MEELLSKLDLMIKLKPYFYWTVSLFLFRLPTFDSIIIAKERFSAFENIVSFIRSEARGWTKFYGFNNDVS